MQAVQAEQAEASPSDEQHAVAELGERTTSKMLALHQMVMKEIGNDSAYAAALAALRGKSDDKVKAGLKQNPLLPCYNAAAIALSRHTEALTFALFADYT